MKQILIILFSCICITTGAQQLYTADAFIQQVKQYHPVAKQAALAVERAAAEVLASRGGFDPTFTFNASNKTFDGKNYYYYDNPELKIPTWIGANVKAGLESNGGDYLDTEITPGKTSYVGIEMPLAKGLVMDKRRAALQQAKIYQDMSEQDRLNAVNDLLFQAYTAYWQWAGTFSLYSIYSRFLQIATDRFRLVKIAFDNGDRSAMDTLEALTQVQNFQLLQAEARMKLNDASIDLSNYLWDENDSAFLLPVSYVPDTVQFALMLQPPQLDDVITRAASANPALRNYSYKLDALDVERRLKFQSLLPEINGKYNLLNKGYNVFKGVSSTAFLENNYKWGIDIKVPLFLREGRGDYSQAKLKIRETNYAFAAKRWEVENKIRSYHNQFLQLQNQVQVAQSAFSNYGKLLQQEDLRFRNGESSLFIVNTRENKVIETAQKLVELRIKYQKAFYAVQWAGGLLR